MQETLRQMSRGLPPPNQDDLDMAEAVLCGGVSFAGDENLKASKNPSVYELQKRCIAYGLVWQRINNRKTGEPAKPLTPEQHAENMRQKLIREQQAAATALNAGQRYNHVAMASHDTRQTRSIDYFREKWQADSFPSVLLCGGTGTGKTYAAIAGVASQMQSRKTEQGSLYWNAMFVSADDIKAGLGVDGREQRAEMKRRKWLILDDLPVHTADKVSHAFVTEVQDIFNARHRQGLCTVVTSNGSYQDVFDTYGERFASRMGGDGFILEDGGEDLRLVTANPEF
jgi:DNA replication protein DnaC